MLDWLGGRSDAEASLWSGAEGRRIASVSLEDDREDGSIHIRYVGGGGIQVFDRGRSCCESRYITTDDDLESFAGAEILGLELREGPVVEDEWEVHEVEFFVVKTSEGPIAFETHNEHNGYYGGFSIRIDELKEDAE